MMTSMAWTIGEAIVPYIRGAPFLDLFDGQARVHRLDPSIRTYPLDVWEHARTGAGVRLEFRCSAREVRMRLRYLEVRAHPEASLWQVPAGGPAHAARRVGSFDPKGQAGDHELCFALPGGKEEYTLYLPYNSVVEVCGLAPSEALEPLPENYPRWLAFGDSITHGNNASDPGLTYPALVARQLGIDHWNLGFSGAARGEPAVAEAIGRMPADVISLAFGTNLMRFTHWYDRNSWREAFRNFVTVIRNGHPDTPLLVITPIYRSAGSAETMPNVRGMTQRDIREVEEKVVLAKQIADDINLQVLSGLDVLPEDSADLLVDGVHPGDAGMELMAKAIAPRIAALIQAGNSHKSPDSAF